MGSAPKGTSRDRGSAFLEPPKIQKDHPEDSRSVPPPLPALPRPWPCRGRAAAPLLPTRGFPGGLVGVLRATLGTIF